MPFSCAFLVNLHTHIPGTGMAVVEEAALGKSRVCRWCAGVSAAGAGV